MNFQEGGKSVNSLQDVSLNISTVHLVILGIIHDFRLITDIESSDIKKDRTISSPANYYILMNDYPKTDFIWGIKVIISNGFFKKGTFLPKILNKSVGNI